MTDARSRASFSTPLTAVTSSTPLSSRMSMASITSAWSQGKNTQRWRHALGIMLLLVTVVLWTASNFLASTIFADDSYDKPYFVTYINTAFFVIPLIPMLARRGYQDPSQFTSLQDLWRKKAERYSKLQEHDTEAEHGLLKPTAPARNASLTSESSTALLPLDRATSSSHASARTPSTSQSAKLTLREIAKLSIEFCFLWFTANYFTAACLSYTTVASSTILTSTSSIWTLLTGSIIGVERFTLRKLIGVLASLAGIVLISTVDISGESDENRGSFPHKSQKEIAIGDALAFLSAVLYGFYVVLMKKRIGDESRVNMALFLGLVGLFNVLLLWPGLVVLHYTGVETFELPPTGRILTIVLVNSFSSLVSDFCWAYAMLLTSPLVVTVGLSMTIPLSLVGQMVLDAQYSSFVYWVGALVVVLSFIFINHEESHEEEGADVADDEADGFGEEELVGSP
ncbi:hypothetical protein W97_09137 [Coniosporium apollinis CBS 100218]|uniref:DUF3955 domain-containing protein n=1 Tax=Coniosporium apollinis (strain CBS 100218) TaxID=1168221 RepID=R7Z6Y7_CONA1|nr:uncharacterized protein W97_09137 [Coniosporium apollinis CBS 100218]EON69873.1 hypothetical protein W97_09137 [Coniosporium apollinis CBS 100218]